MRTILLEFTEGIGLRTWTGRTLLELTGRKGLLESTRWISTGSTKLLELTEYRSVLELTGRSGLLDLTEHIIILKLIERTCLWASTGRTDSLKLRGRTDLRPSTVHMG